MEGEQILTSHIKLINKETNSRSRALRQPPAPAAVASHHSQTGFTLCMLSSSLQCTRPDCNVAMTMGFDGPLPWRIMWPGATGHTVSQMISGERERERWSEGEREREGAQEYMHREKERERVREDEMGR